MWLIKREKQEENNQTLVMKMSHTTIGSMELRIAITATALEKRGLIVSSVATMFEGERD